MTLLASFFLGKPRPLPPHSSLSLEQRPGYLSRGGAGAEVWNRDQAIFQEGGRGQRSGIETRLSFKRGAGAEVWDRDQAIFQEGGAGAEVWDRDQAIFQEGRGGGGRGLG